MPVPTSAHWLLIAGLSAVALITLGVNTFRDDQGGGVVLPSPAAALPTLATVPSPVDHLGPAPPPTPEPAEVTAPALDTTAQRRVIKPPSPTRSNQRTDPLRSAVQPRELPSPTAAPVSASPIVLQRSADEADRAPASSRTAIPDNDPPKVAAAPALPAAAPTVTGGAATVSPAPVSVVPAAVARQTPPRLVTGGAPEYPAPLRTARVGGSVEVRFTIDSSGRVSNVQSVTGPLLLRSAAEAAVRRWRYEPARLGNVAVETQTSVNFNFDPSTIRRPQH